MFRMRSRRAENLRLCKGLRKEVMKEETVGRGHFRTGGNKDLRNIAPPAEAVIPSHHAPGCLLWSGLRETWSGTSGATKILP